MTAIKNQPGQGMPPKSPLQITIARAMSLKLFPGTHGHANFVVHLESHSKGVIHGTAKGFITRTTGLDFSPSVWLAIDALCKKLTGRSLQPYRTAFPPQLWPVAEELCRRLSGQSLDASRITQFLSAAAEDTAQLLERDGQTELAGIVRAVVRDDLALDHKRRSRFWMGVFEIRKWILHKQLSRLLTVFSAALRHLATAPITTSHDIYSLNGCDDWLQFIECNCCFPEPPLPSLNGKPANIYTDASYLKFHTKDATKGHLLEREALAYGLSILRFPNGSFFAYDRHGGRLNFKWSRSPVSSAVSLALCCHKDATRARLRRYGLPVPRGHTFAGGDYARAAAYANSIGYPVVLKPAAGLRGIGVISNIANETELKAAFQIYSQSELGSDDFIVEQHVNGKDYRIVVIGKQVVSAICREPASVLGDGLHTVLDLVLFKNKIRTLNPHLRRRLISLDEAALYKLGQVGLTPYSVPARGQLVQLAPSSNISRGGDSIETVDELHPSIRDAAIRAVEAIPGLGFCGLDFLLEDHTKPINQQYAAIIEMNAHGAIGTGQYPMWGTPRNVARQFLLYCARRVDIELKHSPAARLSLQLTVRGRVGAGYQRWFAHKAQEFGLTGWIRRPDGITVQAALEGETVPVAALVNAAVRGPGRATPYWVKAEHVPYQDYTDFLHEPVTNSGKRAAEAPQAATAIPAMARTAHDFLAE